MAADDVYQQALALLSACETILGARVPSLTYVTPGTPAHEGCGILAVNVTQEEQAPTGPSTAALDPGHRRRYGAVNVTTMVVTITRCDVQPGIDELPDPVAKAQVAQVVLTDMWVLWNGLYYMSRDQESVLFQECGEVTIGPARAIEPSGNIVGWTIPVTVSTEGYNPLEPGT